MHRGPPQASRRPTGFTVNFDEVDPVEHIVDVTDGDGTDKGIDAVGYQAVEIGGAEEQPRSC